MSGPNLPDHPDRQALLMQLAAEGRKQRALRRPLRALLALCLCLMVLPLFYVSPGLFALLAATIALVTSGFAISLRRSAARFERFASDHIAPMEDIKAVGPLLEALDIPNGPTRQAIRAALIYLLPRLDEEDGKQ